MANKETINLIDCRSLIGKYPQYASSNKSFKIKSMKNTIYYQIGDHLSHDEVKDLIEIHKWNVNIVEKMESE